MLNVLQCLVEHEHGYHTDAINQQDYNGCTALHLALEYDCSDSVLQYLSNAANVSIGDKKGETALHTAVRNDHSKAVILALLGSKHGGANAANMQDFMGKTVLHSIIVRYHEDDDGKEIVCALSQVTNVDAQDPQGRTALHYAVECCKLAFVNVLLYEQKTNRFLQYYYGITPLSLACKLCTINTCSQLSVIFVPVWCSLWRKHGMNT